MCTQNTPGLALGSRSHTPTRTEAEAGHGKQVLLTRNSHQQLSNKDPPNSAFLVLPSLPPMKSTCLTCLSMSTAKGHCGPGVAFPLQQMVVSTLATIPKDLEKYLNILDVNEITTPSSFEEHTFCRRKPDCPRSLGKIHYPTGQPTPLQATAHQRQQKSPSLKFLD